MGMSASQARYLSLTGRKSDLEFEAQKVAQSRISLAQESEDVANAYNNAMNNRGLFFQPMGEEFKNMKNLPQLTYDALTKSFAEGGLGMRILDENRKIVSPFLPNDADPEDYNIDLNVLIADNLEKMLRDGNWILQKYNLTPENGNGEWVDSAWQGNANIVDDYDIQDDKAAEAEYDVRSEFLKTQDKKLEMRSTQIATEQKSLDQEMEAVKKVIDKNVESTFKTFA